MALPNLDVSMATLEAEMIIPKNPEDTVDGPAKSCTTKRMVETL